MNQFASISEGSENQVGSLVLDHQKPEPKRKRGRPPMKDGVVARRPGLKNDQLLEVIMSRLDKNGPNGCWIWKAGRFRGGYGCIRLNGSSKKAHRIVYQMLIGEIPEGMSVCHKCDNPPCANPDHLFLASHAENMKDMQIKKRYSSICGCQRYNAKMNEESVALARKLKRDTNMTCVQIAKQFNVYQSTIVKICSGKSWAHVPMPS